jgi:hypothetical protein
VRAPRSVRSAEDFGRIRLSRNFFMREFLYSEIANVHGFTNLPSHPDLAISAGRALCEHILEPLTSAFGRIAIRSGYRTPEVSGCGSVRYGSCAMPERDRARHIWDERSKDGGMGAMVTVLVPWLVDRLPAGITWVAMAWWIHDHLPYSEVQFFPKLTAFNVGWHEYPKRRISSFAKPRGLLTKPGMANHIGNHREAYPGFPALR